MSYRKFYPIPIIAGLFLAGCIAQPAPAAPPATVDPIATYLTPPDMGTAQPLPFAGSGGFKLTFGQSGTASLGTYNLDTNTFKTDIYEIIIKKTK